MNTVNQFACLQCNVTFSNKGNLHRHQKNIHAQNDIEITCNQVCGACNQKCRTIIDLQKHIQKEHADIKLQFQEKVFYCQSDFDQWKAEIERDSVSSFTLHHTKKYEDVVVSQYRCHRSGLPVLKSNSERKRRTKISGSIKNGITCPSMIKTTKETFDDAIEIRVEFQSTHLGHKCEVGKLPLQKQDRCNLAAMLSAGIPTTIVLDKTKEQYSPTKRLGHTTKQDLYNVCRDFNVRDIAHKDDATAVDITVHKMMNEEYNPVLVYKPLGEKLDQYTNIKEDEFLLVISNEAQVDLLKMFGDQTVDDQKSLIREYLKNISRKVEAEESVENLIYVKDHLKNIESYLDSSKTSELHVAEISKTIPPN